MTNTNARAGDHRAQGAMTRIGPAAGEALFAAHDPKLHAAVLKTRAGRSLGPLKVGDAQAVVAFAAALNDTVVLAAACNDRRVTVSSRAKHANTTTHAETDATNRARSSKRIVTAWQSSPDTARIVVPDTDEFQAAQQLAADLDVPVGRCELSHIASYERALGTVRLARPYTKRAAKWISAVSDGSAHELLRMD